jgi:hypothetical protein
MKSKNSSRWIHFVSQWTTMGTRNTGWMIALLLLCAPGRAFVQNEAPQDPVDEVSSAHPTRSYLFADLGEKEAVWLREE